MRVVWRVVVILEQEVTHLYFTLIIKSQPFFAIFLDILTKVLINQPIYNIIDLNSIIEPCLFNRTLFVLQPTFCVTLFVLLLLLFICPTINVQKTDFTKLKYTNIPNGYIFNIRIHKFNPIFLISCFNNFF